MIRRGRDPDRSHHDGGSGTRPSTTPSQLPVAENQTGASADAAKAYLVSKGIDPIRIEIASRGESQPIATGTSTNAQAQNRRAEFRLLVASDYLLPPKK